jgi:hypothetical protein
MRPLTEELVVRAIDAELLSHGFEPRSVPSVDGAPVVALWTRKTWNTNRAAVVLRLESAAQPSPLSQRMKIPLGKAGQVVTGKFQDAIERGIHVSLAPG